MANNPNVNKVVYGNTTVMDISDTTAEEADVVSGKTFYKASGARSTGSAVIPSIANCYETTDTAETAIDDADYFPFYDSSATAKRKSLWSNIKSVLKTYFDTLYLSLSNKDSWTTASTVSNGSVSFSGLDDTQGWGYVPHFYIDDNSTNLNPTCEVNTISGSGTASMSITYTTDADTGVSCKLRIEK